MLYTTGLNLGLMIEHSTLQGATGVKAVTVYDAEVTTMCPKTHTAGLKMGTEVRRKLKELYRDTSILGVQDAVHQAIEEMPEDLIALSKRGRKKGQQYTRSGALDRQMFFEAIRRVVKGEAQVDVAESLGVAPSVISRALRLDGRYGKPPYPGWMEEYKEQRTNG